MKNNVQQTVHYCELYGVTIDRIVKDDDECNILLCKNADIDINKVISFLVSAKKILFVIINYRGTFYKEGAPTIFFHLHLSF